MGRPSRLQGEDYSYHLTSRGDGGKKIYLSRYDYELQASINEDIILKRFALTFSAISKAAKDTQRPIKKERTISR